MAIGDVSTQDLSNQPQETSPNDTTPPAQCLDQDNHSQEESNGQGGDEDDEDKGEVPPYPRVCQNVQRYHPSTTYLVISKKG
jgi:hypothetical protein